MSKRQNGKGSDRKPEVPVVEIPSVTVDYSSSKDMEQLGELFSNQSLSQTLCKLSILEAFLNIAVKDIDFPEYTRQILNVVLATLKCEAGSILELDHHNDVFFFRAVSGVKSDQVSEFLIPKKQGLAGYILETRAPTIVNNLKDNLQHIKSIEKIVGFKSRNMAIIPIVIRGEPYGVMEIINRVGQDGFTDEDLSIIKYICDKMTKTIEIRMKLAWAKKHTTGESDVRLKAA